jgi:putative transcriptional regulator
LTDFTEDPLYIILRSKREATRFQILVEIAEHQPSIRQQEIATKLGVTPQAVSEYIRDLVDEGFVTAHGRGRYEVTKNGIEWVLHHAEALEAYARHITREIIQQVAVWTAIARDEIQKGDTVGVLMQDG